MGALMDINVCHNVFLNYDEYDYYGISQAFRNSYILTYADWKMMHRKINRYSIVAQL